MDDYHSYTYGRKPEREAEESTPLQVEVIQPRMQWTPAEPVRRSNFRGVVLSFLAGAIVVGSLMFMSDRMNLFSSEVVASTNTVNTTSGNAIQTVQTNNVSSADLSTAAIDIVRPNTIPELVDLASPAVVKIETYATRSSQFRSNRLSDEFFRDFFGDFFGTPDAPQTDSNAGNMVQVGAGSGFFFDAEGYILTNEHVVHGAEKVQVIVTGHKEPYVAEVLGTAYEMDLAVLKIVGKESFPALPLGSSEKMNVGDWVVAIGNPYEFDHTVTVGVLSAKERSFNIPDTDGTRKYQALFQTDASINPGNSGGPLLNLNGEVIGINTAVNAQAQGIGFAIPTSTINGVLDSLKANETIPRPYIGIRMGDVPEQYIDDLGMANTDGAFITEVLFDSPAYRAGIEVYDVILKINGESIADAAALQKNVATRKPGEVLQLTILRNKQEMIIEITVGDLNKAN